MFLGWKTALKNNWKSKNYEKVWLFNMSAYFSHLQEMFWNIIVGPDFVLLAFLKQIKKGITFRHVKNNLVCFQI